MFRHVWVDSYDAFTAACSCWSQEVVEMLVLRKSRQSSTALELNLPLLDTVCLARLGSAIHTYRLRRTYTNTSPTQGHPWPPFHSISLDSSVPYYATTAPSENLLSFP